MSHLNVNISAENENATRNEKLLKETKLSANFGKVLQGLFCSVILFNFRKILFHLMWAQFFENRIHD